MKLSKKALDLVIRFEVTSEDNYNKKLKNPIWPQASSGITIGIGYDLGYVTAQRFAQDFAALPKATVDLLKPVCGLKGVQAKNKLASVKIAEVPWATAVKVFESVSVPHYASIMQTTFPGVTALHEDVQGALWSLIYNRGGSLEDPDPNSESATPPPGKTDRRWEMRRIRAMILEDKASEIPWLIRSMKRLWLGETVSGGLSARREAEALLAESGLAKQQSEPGGEDIEGLPDLTRSLQLGDSGEDVLALQKALQQIGYEVGTLDGDFGPKTSKAVKLFQARSGLNVDGVVGAKTWSKLGGKIDDSTDKTSKTAEERRREMAKIAKGEALKNLKWSNAQSEAEKYLKPLRDPMIKLGHIQSAPVFFNWCSAFVTWCARGAGFDIEDIPEGSGVTMALAASWTMVDSSVATQFKPGQIVLEPGDIVLFDWPDAPKKFDHVGIVIEASTGSSTVKVAEGNAGNKTAVMDRKLSHISGVVRLK